METGYRETGRGYTNYGHHAWVSKDKEVVHWQ